MNAETPIGTVVLVQVGLWLTYHLAGALVGWLWPDETSKDAQEKDK